MTVCDDCRELTAVVDYSRRNLCFEDASIRHQRFHRTFLGYFVDNQGIVQALFDYGPYNPKK